LTDSDGVVDDDDDDQHNICNVICNVTKLERRRLHKPSKGAVCSRKSGEIS